MTAEVEHAFWELLRAGLWKKPPMLTAKLSDEQWGEVMKYAKRQTLIGVLFDGMLHLPVDLQPTEDIRMKWFWKVNRIELANRKQNQVLVKITEKLEEKGIKTMVLKGQSYAILYPQPLHRQPGDIDLFVGKKNLEAVSQWIETWGMTDSKHSYHSLHINAKWQGVSIELHRTAAIFGSFTKQRQFVKWSEQVLEQSTFTFTPMDEKEEVHIPNTVFNALYVFYHLFFHFVHGGVGLRQLCDWACMLHVNHNKINQQELKQRLNCFGLLNAWQVFGYLLVHHIGLPQEEFPFYKETKKKASIILEDIMEQGNFGHSAEKQFSNDPNYLARKRKNFFFHTKRYLKTMRLFPVLGLEAFGFFLLERGKHFFTDYFKAK